MASNDEILAILKDIAAVLPTLATKEEMARCATKEDLARFATKEDLARCATRDDLARCATKEDLQRLATRDDLAAVKTEVTSELKAMRTDIAVLGGRLDEQRHVLAALIPRTVAAVPRSRSGS